MGEEPVTTYVCAAIVQTLRDPLFPQRGSTFRRGIHAGVAETILLDWDSGERQMVDNAMLRVPGQENQKIHGAVYPSPSLIVIAIAESPGTDVSVRFSREFAEDRQGKSQQYVLVLKVVNILSPHTEGYALTTDENTAKGCAGGIGRIIARVGSVG